MEVLAGVLLSVDVGILTSIIQFGHGESASSVVIKSKVVSVSRISLVSLRVVYLGLGLRSDQSHPCSA